MTDHEKLDALLLARTLGLTAHELAQALSQDVSTLAHDPTGDGLQLKLQALDDLALQLRDMFGSPEMARLWLRAANPVLAAQTPMSYLLRGDTVALEKLLLMAETGMPT